MSVATILAAQVLWEVLPGTAGLAAANKFPRGIHSLLAQLFPERRPCMGCVLSVAGRAVVLELTR